MSAGSDSSFTSPERKVLKAIGSGSEHPLYRFAIRWPLFPLVWPMNDRIKAGTGVDVTRTVLELGGGPPPNSGKENIACGLRCHPVHLPATQCADTPTIQSISTIAPGAAPPVAGSSRMPRISLPAQRSCLPTGIS